MLLKFINRKEELAFLEERYASKTCEFIPLYGRRRVGKTELIKQFVKSKPHFYFLAKKKKISEEMDRFRLRFSREANIFLPETKSWDELFSSIFQSYKKRIIIVIDEFPYWVEKDNSILSDFQHLLDETLVDKNMILILCGSSMSIMETDILGYKSPLYGRRTGQLELHKLGFSHVLKFFPQWKLEDIMMAYGALDGIPFYLKEFVPDKGFLENINNTFWKSGSLLNKEVEFLLSQELREVEVYLSIMRTIFEGATTITEIASKSHVEITNINKYLHVLARLRFISKIAPITINRPKTKHFRYKVTDHFFNFWLSYVYPYRDEIEIGELERLKLFLKKDYPRYMGSVFEDICKQQIHQCKLPFIPTQVGKWWFGETEIDLVCINDDAREALFFECKWSHLKEHEARKLIAILQEKAAHVLWERKKEYVGVIAHKIEHKESLRKEGWLMFDIDDFM